jgi:hypothetical protein
MMLPRLPRHVVVLEDHGGYYFWHRGKLYRFPTLGELQAWCEKNDFTYNIVKED